HSQQYDRHERLVKLSRDITIASKRAIQALLRCALGGWSGLRPVVRHRALRISDATRASVLQEADKRFRDIR
ncbi:hypothetical protein OE165_27115, partial [Escherichia coli]|uniref:hypothetical protein n=1 Tax=Escherichia coli TaxID=562 RepID=UPI0021F3C831